MATQIAPGISSRYARIMDATGLTKEELDRQSVYMLDAMDILARQIQQLEAKIDASDKLMPSTHPATEIYAAPGCKVQVPGVGTYMFPLDSRVTFRSPLQGGWANWTVRHVEDDEVEMLDVNGPALTVRPRAGNAVQLLRDDQ